MKAEVDLKRDIITVGKMLHDKGYIAATDGNISIKVSSDRILTTASGISKGFLRDEHIVVVDGDGNLVSGMYKPSSELKMHTAAYKLRPELKAIVHGHPPTCTAFTIAGITLAKCILPEVVMTLGTIPTADYATPTTGEVPESIKDFIVKYDAVLLDRHGAITVSVKDVFDAYYKLEKIEHTAEVTLKARQLGHVKTLSSDQIEKLTDISGMEPEKLCSSKCVNCGACGQHNVASNIDRALHGLKKDTIQSCKNPHLETATGGQASSLHGASAENSIQVKKETDHPVSLENRIKEEVIAELKKIAGG